MVSDLAAKTSFGNFTNVVEVIRSHAVSTPGCHAIVDGKRVITYSELWRLVSQCAGHLHELGVRPRDRLGLVLQDHADHLVLMFAAASLGAATLSLNWRSKIDEKQKVADAFGLKLVVGERNVRTPAGIRTVNLDEAWHRDMALAAPHEPIAVAHSFPFRVLLTSGTTGMPKGVELTHFGLFAWCDVVRLGLGLTSRHRHLSPLPLAFTGILCYTLPHLLLGNTVELFPPLFTPEEFIDAVRKRAITGSVIAPPTLRRLLALAPIDEPLFSELKYLVSLGAPLTPEERRAAKKRLTPGFIDNYGASGAGCITFLLPGDNEAMAESVGKCAPLREIQVVGKNDQPLPPGEVGVLRVRGPGVATSFCNETAEAASESFRDGWYYPGEIARLDAEGFVTIVGRTSDLILRGGINIYPAEIEQTLRRHPGVREVAVLGAPSVEYGEDVVAFVQTSDASARDLLELCTRSLAPFKIPKFVLMSEELPRSPAGKLVKSELLRLYQQRN
jgi:acyl-CoA synthetase (AMP-forming)/AMP-acid ligase II